jgi:hypothetical protein
MHRNDDPSVRKNINWHALRQMILQSTLGGGSIRKCGRHKHVTETANTSSSDESFPAIVARWKADDWLFVSFLPALIYTLFGYNLDDLFWEMPRLGFDTVRPIDHVIASDLSLGVDYLFHLVTSFVIFHSICAFISARYRKSRFAPAILVLALSIPSFVTLDYFIPPHGVLAEYLDDVMIYPAIIIAIANIVFARFSDGADKVVPLTAGIAMIALMAVNLIGHVALSLPSEILLKKQRVWMAERVASPGNDIPDFCMSNGYVCVVRGADGREVPIAADPGPHVSKAVQDNVIAAARKYRLLDVRLTQGVPFELRHGALTTPMGIMRYTAFPIPTTDGRAIVAIDGASLAGAALWFHTLFGVFVTIFGGLLVAMIGFVQRLSEPKVSEP